MPRLFVAIVPTEEVRSALLAELASQPLPKHRPTPIGHLHLTVHFIGETGVRELESVAESVLRATGGLQPFRLTVDRLETFPQKGEPRLIAAVADQPPTLLELRDRLVLRLAKSVRAKTRELFVPHLTLARFERCGPVAAINRACQSSVVEVDRIVLFESMLHQSGPEHRVMQVYPLGR